MEKKNLLLTLQKKYRDGGYALIAPKSGNLVAFAKTLKDLYQRIDQKSIDDRDKIVMHIPSPRVKHVF